MTLCHFPLQFLTIEKLIPNNCFCEGLFSCFSLSLSLSPPFWLWTKISHFIHHLFQPQFSPSHSRSLANKTSRKPCQSNVIMGVMG